MAVVVRDLYFGYKSGLKSKSILNGINMNVNEGSIYALLGPSGCGKTTLLNIIIGLRKAKFGDVYLYGYKGCCKANGIPGSGLGYMPQDLGLQYDLTILEILNYFGNFAMLSASDIKKESLLMIKRFNLPAKHRLIGQLSGGQKRLVSLAVALLHKPRLLILDEPTVGVDPLLRATIWNYLLDLSAAECVTTIITTHYVDEAKRANIVAFMRKGEILCEGNPNQFLDTYNVSTLDEVLLTLCLGQGPRPQAIDMITDGDEDQPLTMKPFKIKNMNSFYSFYRITQSLIKKYMIESRRNPMTLIALFLFTFVSIVTAMLVFGSPMLDLKVAWVNDGVDQNFWINHFDEFGINNTLMNSTIFSSEIQLLLRDSMDPSVIKLIEFKSLPKALDSMEMFNIHGIIYLKSNFSDYYTLCDPFISDTFDIDCNENEIIANASITLYTDETNPILSDALKFTIGHSIQNFRLKVARLIGINEHRLRPPFEIELLSGDAINTNNYNFEHFTAPGFLVIAPFGFSAAICILTIITEKQTDMSIRNYASGVKPHHTVFAEIIAKFSFLLLSTLFNILCTIKFFDLPCRGSLLLVILLSALQVLLGITQGILFSSMFSKSMLSFLTCTFVLIGTLLTTGAIWSVESQPFIYQWINYLLPFAHSIKSMRCLLLKPNATFHPQISMGFIMSSFYTIFNTILSLLLLNFKQYFF